MFYGESTIYLLWKASEMLLSCVVQIHLHAHEDIADGILEIGFAFKRLYTYVNVFICGILPHDCYWSVNRLYIKDGNEKLKLKCVRFSFSYIGQDTDWTLANGSLNPELFYSDKIHLVEKDKSKLSKSIRKSIQDFYDTEISIAIS